MVVIGVLLCSGVSLLLTCWRDAWYNGRAIPLGLHKCSTRAYTIPNYSFAPHPYFVEYLGIKVMVLGVFLKMSVVCRVLP